MPCWTITAAKVSVDLSKLSLEILIEGLKADGAEVFKRAGGDIEIRNHPVLGSTVLEMSRSRFVGGTAGYMSKGQAQNSLAQSYSKQVVRSQSKKYGWQVTENGNQMTVQRRF